MGLLLISPLLVEKHKSMILRVRNAVVEEDRDAQNIRQTNGNRVWVPSVLTPAFQGNSPRIALPQPDSLSAHRLSKPHVNLYFA